MSIPDELLEKAIKSALRNEANKIINDLYYGTSTSAKEPIGIGNSEKMYYRPEMKYSFNLKPEDKPIKINWKQDTIELSKDQYKVEDEG